jgi:hypothetical protein
VLVLNHKNVPEQYMAEFSGAEQTTGAMLAKAPHQRLMVTLTVF